MRNIRTQQLYFALGLAAVALTPRCNCETSPEIGRAAVQMRLTLVEVDPCSGSAVPRNIPDDYERAGLPLISSLGSTAERVFEVRSVGTAPLSVDSVTLSEQDDEFLVETLDSDGQPLELPIQIPANLTADAVAPMVIKVSYASADDVGDAVKLLIATDDPARSQIEFDLVAGKGRLEVCGTNGCDMPAVNFGSVSQNTSATQEVTIKNTGDGQIDLRDIAMTSVSTEFCSQQVTSLPDGVADCPLNNLCKVLLPGETYTVTVRYTPTNGGNDIGNINITTSDASIEPIDVPINGVGAGPAICAYVLDANMQRTPATSVDFGFVSVGATETRTVQFESCGSEPVNLDEAVLEMDPMSFYNTDPAFSISMPFMTGMLMPSQTVNGEISYAPTRSGEATGGLRYTHSQNVKSWIALTGKAATCDLDALPNLVSFGTVAGGQSSDRTVVLFNNGAKECTVTAIGDPTSSEFTIENKPTLPLTVMPGASERLTVRYSAPARQSPSGDTATFEVTSDEPAPNETNTVTLTAQGGGTPVCSVEVQPTAGLFSNRDGELQFGATTIGYPKTLSVRIRNVGNADCTLQSYRLQTQAPMQFSATTAMPTPMVIPPSTVGNIDVTFSPTSGAMTLFPSYLPLFNYIDFVLAGPGLVKTDWSIGINARPTIPTIDIIPGDVDFGVITWDRPQPPDMRSSCGSEVRSVRIYNSGTGMLTVTRVAIDPSSDPVFAITQVVQNGNNISAPYAMTIAPGENAEVSMRFFPTRIQPAQHRGLLIVENNVTTQSTVPLRGEGTPNAAQTDVFDQLNDNKVDILWVIDDSGSMSDEQLALSNNIQWFTNYASSLNANWQMGVITTEVNDSASGKLWSCNGFNKIIRHTDTNANQAFRCAANVTRPPNGNRRPNPMGSDEQEAGLQAARIALDAPVRDMENMGFLRPDARLAVITVSDEEDQSQGPVSLYVDFFRNIKGFRNPQLFSLSAIAGDVPGGCGGQSGAQAGVRYNDAVRQLNGQFESICNSDWSQMLRNIGLDVFALRRAWTLSRPADAATITVRVGGTTVRQDGSNGWTYDPVTNSINFHGSAIPQSGSRVEVTYNARCIP